MDLKFSDEEVAFRDEVRTWLHDHAPKEPRPRDGAPIREFDMGWMQRQWESGWAGISWPSEYGGRGLSLTQQLVWHEEYAHLGLPGIDCSFVGLNHAGPTLIARASEEQKAAHLPGILRGDSVWCQGFSEPGAGSDLAALQTRAEVDGDELVVTGQKVWTSFADLADWQELLVRTDPGTPKHKGITWVICDMHAPGVDIRPIRTIDHDHHFAEVFYDNVRIPLGNIVGAINDGWNVAMSTLAFERGTAFTGSQVSLAIVVERLIDVARSHPGPGGRGLAIQDEELARRLARARAEVAALRAMTYAAISRNAHHAVPGPEGSMLKLYYSDLHQAVTRLAMDVLGADGLRRHSEWVYEYLRGYSMSIGGGTSEVQRNIIGERVLGLPALMDLTLSPEQSAVVEATASFLARELPMVRIRAQLERPSSRPEDVWAACAALGWFGLGLPSSLGGVGYGLAEEALLFRELGRYLAPGPFLATVLGGHVAALAGSAELASSIVGGGTVVGLADARPDGRWDLIDATEASVVVEVDAGGAQLFSVDDLTEITVEPCIDDATRLAWAVGDRIRPIATVAGPAMHQRGTVLVAAMLAGIAAATRDQAVAYAKVREQYGKPIGAYQAIKHPSADMAVRAEAADAQALFAAVCVDQERSDAGFQASAAKVVAADAALRNGAATVQIHGGIGFTFECDAHLFVKRAHVLDRLLGDSRAHLESVLAGQPIQ